MPLGGGGSSEGLGTGTAYVETVSVRAGIRPSQADIYVASATGPFVYTETAGVRIGRQSSQADVYVGYDPDPYAVTVTCRVGIFTQTFPSSNLIFLDSPAALVGRFSVSLERVIAAESLAARMARRSGQGDIFVDNSGGVIYYEFVIAQPGFRTSSTFQFIGSAAAVVSVGRIPSASFQLITADIPIARLGLKPAESDSRLYPNDTVAARLGARAAAQTAAVVYDLSAARKGARASVAAQLVASDALVAKIGRKAGNSATQSFSDTTAAKHAMRSGSIPIAVNVNTVQVRVGASPFAFSQAVLPERPTVRVGFISQMILGKGYVELISARRGKRPIAVSQLIISEIVAAEVRLKAGRLALPLDSTGLIPAIRYNIAKALPGLTQIPEALPDEETARQMVKPYAIILAHEPVQEEFAVNDQAERVPVDILLVYEEAVGVDNPQLMRADLHLVSEQLTADYQQFGNTDTPAAINTERVATPMERANAYQTHYRDMQQPVAAMVLSIECVVVESLLDAEI